MKLFFTLVTVIIFTTKLSAQVPSFDEIYVTHRIDSLNKILPKQTGSKKLSTLLSIYKSISVWDVNGKYPSFNTLAVLVKQFPEAKGHYLYFKSKFDHSSTGTDTAFFLSKAAYQYYLTQKDTTGMISALINMGVLNLKIESKAPKKNQFGHHYLQEAANLGEKSGKIESRLARYYALARFWGMNVPASEFTKLINLLKEALSLIDRYPRYIYYKPFFLNIISILYEQRNQYAEAQKYSLEVVNIMERHQKPITPIMLYNIGLFYEKQKKYDLALPYYQKALRLSNNPIQKNLSLLMNITAAYHACLVGLKKYKEAAVWADSIYIYAEEYFAQNNSIKIKDLVVQYEVEKKEAQKRILLQENQLIETRSRLYLLAGLLALLGFLTVGFLAFRLRKSNRKLKTAYHEIVQLNQARDYFFGIIAHDLRRPLSSFQGMTELIKYYVKSKRYDQLGKISTSIDQSGQRIRQTLDNLLVWALSQREEVPYNPEKVLLHEKISRAIELFEPTMTLIAAEIKVECSDKAVVWADANGVELIIRNLLDNALKNLSPNGILSIKALPDPSSPQWVTVSVRDNGHGMEAQTLDMIKTIFLHPETFPISPKRSLGMVLISRFIKRNKGKIEVESVLGQGTDFTFTLPVWKED